MHSIGRVVCAAVIALQCVVWGSFARAAEPSPETRTALTMQRAEQHTAVLRAFLQAMPKGGDLHNHASGSVYAEDLLAWASENGMCVDTATNTLSRPPCGVAQVSAKDLAISDYARYSRVIDALSMRGFENGVGDSRIPGFDRFFFSIDHSGAPRDVAKSLAIAREQASYDHVQYLELMTGGGQGLSDIIARVTASGLPATDFAGLRTFLEPLLPNAIAASRAEYDR